MGEGADREGGGRKRERKESKQCNISDNAAMFPCGNLGWAGSPFVSVRSRASRHPGIPAFRIPHSAVACRDGIHHRSCWR